jgi:PPK2 family polyphosphate:nucleotide phosphotransferase
MLCSMPKEPDTKSLEKLRVVEGEVAGLAGRPTSGKVKDAAETLQDSVGDLAKAQELLYATASRALLLVFQGMDASGKDGAVEHVMSGVNPQGCSVASFKQPSAEELAHDFLWRTTARLPARGLIGVFNRSYYEDVIVVRVHPDLLGSRPATPKLWKQRYKDIRAWERHLHRNGTTVVKFFLHLSKDEQRRRLLARLDDPEKHWKFNPGDIAERQYWDDYQNAYEDAITATSTTHAPWYVIPADDKPAARALVAGVVLKALDDMDLAIAPATPDELAAMEKARTQLEAE